MSHKFFLLALSGLSLLSLSGCGASPLAATPSPVPVTAPSPVSHPIVPAASPTLLLEPGAGVQPWVTAIDHARTGIDLNAYLIDNTAILTALRQAGAHGVPIHVLLAPNPYGEAAAVPEERQALARIPDITVRNAPRRFDSTYAFDHAKYLVINPGTAHVMALIGTPNFTASAFDGDNLEAALSVAGPTAQNATAVFQADWTNRPAGTGPRHALVLSPGATSTWRHLLQASGPIQMMAEEIGDDPIILAQMAAAGPRLHLLCPVPTSSAAQARLAALAAAGVKIRTLFAPYVHAKVLITPQTAFFGSQNLSSVSLQDNREMGMLVNGTARTALAAWFQHWWDQSTPWTAASAASHSTSPADPTASSASSRPWLPTGASMATVHHLWGAPARTYATTYHGQAQIAWMYPTATVYFVHQHLVTVSDH